MTDRQNLSGAQTPALSQAHSKSEDNPDCGWACQHLGREVMAEERHWAQTSSRNSWTNVGVEQIMGEVVSQPVDTQLPPPPA